jgi:16S rRNA (uracil1498-N3)-methyltransferase
MRAAYVQDLKSKPTYALAGDLLHHLVNVVRLEAGEELLLLDGKGLKVLTRVERITKKEIALTMVSDSIEERRFSIDVAIGIPKREALELCLKQATELGVRNIYLVRGAFSQMRVPEVDRLRKLLVSALEQSNAPYLPELIETNWALLPDLPGIFLDSQGTSMAQSSLKTPREVLLIVGPEGGLSPEELALLRGRTNLEAITLPTPILRTPTALSVGAGMLLQRLMD